MKTNKNAKIGENTHVKRSKVINFKTIDTVDRSDDRDNWNAMQFYGEDDYRESSYQSKKQISKKAAERIRARKIGYSILGALRAA